MPEIFEFPPLISMESRFFLSSGIETKTIHRFVTPRQLNREMDEYIVAT